MSLSAITLGVAGGVDLLETASLVGVNLVALHATSRQGGQLSIQIFFDEFIRITPVMGIQPGVARSFEVLFSGLVRAGGCSILS